MRILHIINGLGKGGAEAVLVRLILHDLENEHHVVSLTGPGFYSTVLFENNINVYHINFRDKKVLISNILSLLRVIKGVDPSIVQTWLYLSDLVGSIAARLVGIEKVFWNIRHSELNLKDTKFTTILVAKLCSMLSRWLPKGIVFCANKSYEYHKKFGYSSECLAVIHNGYDFDALDSCGSGALVFPHVAAQKPDHFKLGMVGRHAPEKDYANLFEALSILVAEDFNFHCYLAGTDIVKSNQELLELIKIYKLGHHVTLLGEINYVPQFMRFLDAHVLSSSSEGFPNVVAEAMYCKTPCISTNVGDVKDIMADLGWIVPTKSPVLLADAITNAYVEFFQDSNRWYKRRQSCNQHIHSSFSIESMVRSYTNFWNT